MLRGLAILCLYNNFHELIIFDLSLGHEGACRLLKNIPTIFLAKLDVLLRTYPTSRVEESCSLVSDRAIYGRRHKADLSASLL